jgi:nuclear pore complex protein Nup107
MAEDKLLQQKAQLLLDEAASWSLLWYLYGKGNTIMTNHLIICYIDSFSLQ